MFIEQFRLEANPFADGHIRPYFVSESVRSTGRNISELWTRQLQCLFVSGPGHVGKSALVDQMLTRLTRLNPVRLEPPIENAAQMLEHLMRTAGPGTVEASVPEMRHILEVYLSHQAGNGRQALIVVDAMDRHCAEVLRECESLWGLLLGNRPVVRFLFLSRNEDLVTSMLARHEGGGLAQARHVRLTGFDLEETSAYVRNVLQGAGCLWCSELFPDDVLRDIQAFTQGVVGDIDALCAGALDAVAERPADSISQPRVTSAIVKEVGAALHLRYDDRAWRHQVPREPLLPESVHQSDKQELEIDAARLIVSSGGENVAEVSLNRPRMVLGRDESCDISLNSHFVSRYQNLFMETGEGWLLVDLHSTNGSFVNGRKVNQHYLRDGDMIAIGQHQLRFAGTSAREPAELEPTGVKPRILSSAG